jgi:hypothetical protein
MAWIAWDYQEYAAYIKKSGQISASTNLLRANFMPYRAKGISKPPRLFITYYSMPDWLDIFTFEGFDLQKTPFASMVGRYQQSVRKHQKGVVALLDQIVSTKSGQALLTEVSSTRFSVYVMPYYQYYRTMPGQDFFNSVTRPIMPGEKLSHISDGTAPNFEDATEKGAPLRDDNSQPMSGPRGTGKGANVALFFSAEIWETNDKPKGAGFKSDEILFHELVHVTRMFRGHMTSAPVEGPANFGNIEEYLATAITNIYISEKGPGQPPLRGVYRDTSPLGKVYQYDGTVKRIVEPLPSYWNWLKDEDHFAFNAGVNLLPRELMDIFQKTQPDFYSALAHLPKEKPKFNPAGQHLRGEDDNRIPI